MPYVDLIKWRKAIRHPAGPVNATVRHVLLTLSTWGDSEGGSMFPGIETLSVATALHRDTVGRALQTADSQGWVVRAPRGHGTDPIKAARLFGYSYLASVPMDWPYLGELEHRWETDPNWVSERRHRPRFKPGRVPAQNGDLVTSERYTSVTDVPVLRNDVLVQSRKGPRAKPALSPRRALTVPAQPDMKSSSTSSIKSSVRDSDEGALTRTTRAPPTESERAEAEKATEARKVSKVRTLLKAGMSEDLIPKMMHATPVTVEEVRQIAAEARQA